MPGTQSWPLVCQTINYLVGCLDSTEHGMLEWWNCGIVSRASLLNELEAKGVVLGLYLLTLGFFNLLEGQPPHN